MFKIKWFPKASFILHIFVGVGALFGGVLGMFNPMGLPAQEMLQRGPFQSLFIPGLFLFFVIGIGNLIAGYIVYKRYRYQSYFSGCFGGILFMWIVIQCYVINEIMVLHIIFFIIGCVQIGLACVEAYRKQVFPMDKIASLLKKGEK